MQRPRRTAARAPEPPREATGSAQAAATLLSSPETAFAARVPPPAPERPRPAARRAIFLDVENTSRPQHLAHVIDHLTVDRRDCQTELVAVANWKVVGHDSARLLAKIGAHLVHSAPSTGVRDWSDLRIAVAAGIWLASARPGDAIEIVSDDRAFDAVGDVAASLGIEFRRLSYRRVVKEDITEIAAPERRQESQGEARSRRRRRGRGGSSGHAPQSVDARDREPRPLAGLSRQAGARSPERGASRPRGPSAHVTPPRPAEPHTAPHDEVVSVVRELVAASPGRTVIIDAVAAALKARGFQRPPGSPRLVTRLRRIREILVSPSGAIALADGGAGASRGEPRTGEDRPPGPAEVAGAAPPGALDGPGPEAEGLSPDGNLVPGATRGRRRRRRGRRGGQRHRAQSTSTA